MKHLLLLGAWLSVVPSFAFERALDEDAWPAVRPAFLPKIAATQDGERGVPGEGASAVVSGGCQEERIVAGRAARFRFVFSGNAPRKLATGSFCLSQDGHVWWREKLSADSFQVVSEKAEGRWTLSFSYTPPLYFNDGTFEYGLSMPGVFTNDGKSPYPCGRLTLHRAPTTPGYEQPVTSCVKDVNGNPEFCINGNPTFLAWGHTRTYDSNPDGRIGPMDLNVWSSVLLSQHWHPATNRFVPLVFDRDAEIGRRAHSNAWFLVDLRMYPPKDWKMAHPQEVCVDEKGRFGSYWATEFSYASKSALENIIGQMREAIAYLEHSPYANRIVAYRISTGDTSEWLGFTPTTGGSYDFSKPSRERFVEWARQHHPELTNPEPPVTEARFPPDGESILWDQARHLPAVAFQEFYSDCVAEDLVAACRAAKEMLGGRKAVGAYYGYTFYLNYAGCAHHRAHFAVEKILDSKALDYVVSPLAYGNRRLGGPMTDMKPFATFRNHGILCVSEDDSRTHNRPYIPRYGFDQTFTAQQTIDVISRNLATDLCRRNVTYLLPLDDGRGFDFPEMRPLCAAVRTLGEHLLETGAPRRSAEIALVIGERSITSLPIPKRYVSSGDKIQKYREDGTVAVETTKPCAILAGEIFGGSALRRWSLAGAPADYVLAEDLSKNPGDYKLYVFLHDFKYDEAFLRAVEGIRARGAVMLWLYAPGWSHGGTSGLDHMERLTGMSFGQITNSIVAGVTMKEDGRFMGLPDERVAPLFYAQDPDEVWGTYENGLAGVAVKRQGKSLSVFSGPWQLDGPFIRRMVDRANVFTYADGGDPLEANEKLVMLHARSAGMKTIRLPKKTSVLDVFGKRLIARDVDRFSFEARLHGTYLFYTADDAENLMSALAEKWNDKRETK